MSVDYIGLHEPSATKETLAEREKGGRCLVVLVQMLQLQKALVGYGKSHNLEALGLQFGELGILLGRLYAKSPALFEADIYAAAKLMGCQLEIVRMPSGGVN